MRYFVMINTKPSLAYTEHALRSFFETTPFRSDDRFLLIDNDASGTFHDPRIEVIVNDAPRGFAANMNRALSMAASDKADVYLLNNDLIFTDRWFEPLAVERDSVLSPLSNRELQYKTQALPCTVSMSLEDYLGKEAVLRAIVHEHQKTNRDYLKVLVVPFFCAKLPYAIHSKLGELDESYGNGGGEDYDYCLRAYLEGFDVHYALGSYILHFGGKSSWSGAETKEQQLEREGKFFGRFKERWGKALSDIVLYEKTDDARSDLSVSQAIERGDLKRVIELLAPK